MAMRLKKRLSDDLAEKVKALQRATGQSRSDVVRAALERYFADVCGPVRPPLETIKSFGLIGCRETETGFVNVDLDIEAPHDLAPLVAALGKKVFDLHTAPKGDAFESRLELGGKACMPETAEAAIQAFIKLLTRLPLKARRLWDAATIRDFNIGIQGGTRPHAFEFALRPETLRAVAEMGARVVVTVYSVRPEESD